MQSMGKVHTNTDTHNISEDTGVVPNVHMSRMLFMHKGEWILGHERSTQSYITNNSLGTKCYCEYAIIQICAE